MSKGDLDSALHFVIDRISQEADRSGARLDDGEEDFLDNLPSQPTNPTLFTGFNTAHEFGWANPILRDFKFERLCTLAKQARKYDISTSPNADKRWSFAFVVLQSHHHPMSWLLRWGGVRLKKGRAFDGFLLVLAGVLFVASMMAVLFGLSDLAEGQTETWKRVIWAAGAVSFIILLALIQLLARRVEKWQQRKIVEEFRCDLHGTD